MVGSTRVRNGSTGTCPPRLGRDGVQEGGVAEPAAPRPWPAREDAVACHTSRLADGSAMDHCVAQRPDRPAQARGPSTPSRPASTLTWWARRLRVSPARRTRGVGIEPTPAATAGQPLPSTDSRLPHAPGSPGRRDDHAPVGFTRTPPCWERTPRWPLRHTRCACRQAWRPRRAAAWAAGRAARRGDHNETAQVP